jgi:UDP-N-acetyl-D-mannosaminuronic acid dehydrogenase
LFSAFRAPIVQTTPVQAELAKIWANIMRYTHFALPNLLMMDCERYGANVFEVIDLVNRDYPRGGLAQPGFTAGTCLRKDFTFSEERSNAPGMLLAVSRVNESVPLFLVEGIKRRLGPRGGYTSGGHTPDTPGANPNETATASLGALAGRKVAVLGLAFKADTDDERDSLAHKLIRLLDSRARIASWWTPGTAGGPARCSPTPPSWRRSPRARDEPRARNRRRRHDRRRGRQATAGRPGV